MNDEAKRFNCCVQCQGFWDCPTRAEGAERREGQECCAACSNFELCRIVREKVAEGSGKAG